MEDLIRRSDAIEAIKDNSFALGDDYMEINGYGAIDDIRALPSADRPQGEWETVGEKTLYKRCPFCKRVRAFPDTRFCDWCGARLKGVSNGEDIQSTDE